MKSKEASSFAQNLTGAHPAAVPHDDSTSGTNRLWRLEALRGFAAVYVLLHHVSSSYLKLKHTIWGFPFRFGQEGVLVFFLLSGFVICYSHCLGKSNQNDFATYLFKRGRRIFPIFIISLLLAYIIACIGSHSLIPLNFRLLAGNLFMLQDHPEKPGVFILPFEDNMPLWSLSYEWWFYMMFYPINRWVQVDKQKYLVLALCFLGMAINQFFPNSVCWFLVFFVIWWAGVEMAREFLATKDVTFQRQKTMLVLLAFPMVWYGLTTWHWQTTGMPITFMTYPFIEFRYFLMTTVFLILALLWKKCHFIGFKPTLGWFQPLASISYALYVFHYPIICDLQLFPGNNYFSLDLVLRVILAFVLAWLVEAHLQKSLNSATDPWLKRRKIQTRRMDGNN